MEYQSTMTPARRCARFCRWARFTVWLLLVLIFWGLVSIALTWSAWFEGLVLGTGLMVSIFFGHWLYLAVPTAKLCRNCGSARHTARFLNNLTLIRLGPREEELFVHPNGLPPGDVEFKVWKLTCSDCGDTWNTYERNSQVWDAPEEPAVIQGVA